MAKRVGRPSKLYQQTVYTVEELMFISTLLKPSSNIELKNKIKTDLKNRKHLHIRYEKAKARLFKDNN